jgi:AcrB/AcrD/AcrF family
MSLPVAIAIASASNREDLPQPLKIGIHDDIIARHPEFNQGVFVASDRRDPHASEEIHLPATIRGSVRIGSLATDSSIMAALATVYIVLGFSTRAIFIPFILSTLPSVGVGTVLALLVFGTKFSIIAMIGVIVLIGIVI